MWIGRLKWRQTNSIIVNVNFNFHSFFYPALVNMLFYLVLSSCAKLILISLYLTDEETGSYKLNNLPEESAVSRSLLGSDSSIPVASLVLISPPSAVTAVSFLTS